MIQCNSNDIESNVTNTNDANPERVVNKEAVKVVNNVLVLVIAHHNNLVDDQLLHVEVMISSDTLK